MSLRLRLPGAKCAAHFNPTNPAPRAAPGAIFPHPPRHAALRPAPGPLLRWPLRTAAHALPQ